MSFVSFLDNLIQDVNYLIKKRNFESSGLGYFFKSQSYLNMLKLLINLMIKQVQSSI